jgi:hypothetical protein
VSADVDLGRPTPDGRPLIIQIPCSTRRSEAGASVSRHELVIDRDWGVRVPHDVVGERVAVALGGYLTCVEFADRALPAARELFGLICRSRFPELRRKGDRVWAPARPADGCCRSVRYSGPVEAADHLRSVAHAAAAHATRPQLVSTVFAAVMRAHGFTRDAPFPATDPRQARAFVPGVRDLQLLWRAGVAPQHVAAVHHALGTPGRPLPVNFYLGLVTRRPDLAWVGSGCDAVPASSESDVVAAGADSFRSRMPAAMITDLALSGYGPADVELLASSTGRPAMGVASTLRAWVAAGCRPSASELVSLYDAGVSPYWMPRAASVVRLGESVGFARPSIPVNQLGFLLAVCGSVPLAAAWVRAGHRDALEVAAALSAGLGPYDSSSAGKATYAHAI